jgi:SPP1 gp7 family putative phage head morphogenesis protein
MGLFGKLFQRMKPISVISKRPILDTELATDESAIYKRMKLVPYTPDALLQKKKIDIFNQMMLDPEIEGAINTLKVLRLSSGWEVVGASDSAYDREIKDFVEWNFLNVEGSFDDDLRELLGGLEMGISISELNWREIERGRWIGKYGLKSIKSKNPKYFNIYTDDFDNIQEIGLINISGMEYGREYPTDKFVIYSFNKKYENVFGTSRIRALYDLWFIKQVVLRAWGIYLEKFGHPFPVLKIPQALDDKTRNYLMGVIKQIRLETGFLIPEGVEADLLEASGRSPDVHLNALRWINEQIRKTILGQTLTTETTGQGSYSLGQVHFDILLFYEQQVGIDLASKAINEQIIKRLVDYNYNGVDEYPKFQFKNLIQKDIASVIDKYYAGVERGIIKPIPEDEEKIREWLDLPRRAVEQNPSPAVTDEKVALQKSKSPLEEEEIPLAFAEKIFTGVKRRTFTEYEKATDFAEMVDTQNQALDKYVVEAGKVLDEAVSDLIEQIAKKKIVEDKNFSAIEKLHLKYIGDLRNIFYDLLERHFNYGRTTGRREIVEKKKLKKYQEIELRNITPAEALEMFKAKSFSMAGVESDYILKKVKTVLYNSIKTGATLKDSIEGIKKELEPYFVRGEVDEDALRGSRLETVVRTNVSEALNEGRKSFFEDPSLEGYVVAYQYSAIMDDRVRPNHAAMDGRIYSVNSPVWQMFTPPNGFNCRCILIPITSDEQWEESPPLPDTLRPDAGFSKPGM